MPPSLSERIRAQIRATVGGLTVFGVIAAVIREVFKDRLSGWANQQVDQETGRVMVLLATVTKFAVEHPYQSGAYLMAAYGALITVWALLPRKAPDKQQDYLPEADEPAPVPELEQQPDMPPPPPPLDSAANWLQIDEKQTAGSLNFSITNHLTSPLHGCQLIITQVDKWSEERLSFHVVREFDKPSKFPLVLYGQHPTLYHNEAKDWQFILGPTGEVPKIIGTLENNYVRRERAIPSAGKWRAQFVMRWTGGEPVTFTKYFEWDGKTPPSFTKDPAAASKRSPFGIPVEEVKPLPEDALAISFHGRSSDGLRIYVENLTASTCTCRLVLRNIQRWSERLETFVDDSVLPPYNFELLNVRIAPEKGESSRIVSRSENGFVILGSKRDHTYYRTEKGAWRLQINVTVGSGTGRSQNLDFTWGDDGLSVHA